MADGGDSQPTCNGCGGPLTNEEIYYYETTCEKCEQKFLEVMREEYGECRCLSLNGNGDK